MFLLWEMVDFVAINKQSNTKRKNKFGAEKKNSFLNKLGLNLKNGQRT